MIDRKAALARILRQDLAVSILQLVCAVLLCVIYAVFLTSFGGEFLIVIKGQWILPIFLVLLLGGSIASLVLSQRSLRAGERRGDIMDRIQSSPGRTAWWIGWTAWNLVAVLPILWVGKVLALGALGSVPMVLIGVLSLISAISLLLRIKWSIFFSRFWVILFAIWLFFDHLLFSPSIHTSSDWSWLIFSALIFIAVIFLLTLPLRQDSIKTVENEKQ